MRSLKVRWIGGLLAALTSMVHAGTEPMVTEAAQKAIMEYKSRGDITAISSVIPRLKELPPQNAQGGALLKVSAELLNALYETADPNFQSNKKPAMNSEVPGGRYRAGTAPESIKEPEIRAAYEKVRTEDFKYAEHYHRQHDIGSAIDGLATVLRTKFEKMSADKIAEALVKRGMKPSYDGDFRKRLLAKSG